MYLLFGFNQYYPRGGMNDLLGNFDSEEAIDQWAIENKDEFITEYDHYQVYNIEKGIEYTYYIPDYEEEI